VEIMSFEKSEKLFRDGLMLFGQNWKQTQNFNLLLGQSNKGPTMHLGGY
jgi:hypothetical protein